MLKYHPQELDRSGLIIRVARQGFPTRVLSIVDRLLPIFRQYLDVGLIAVILYQRSEHIAIRGGG